MTVNLNQWALEWGVPFAAVEDLRIKMGLGEPAMPPGNTEGDSEAAAQARVRLEASRLGMRLWRNNRGACFDDRGNFIRFGLGNDSSAIDDVMKSHDLIGIKPVLITPQHVGQTIGQFVSREMKPPGWRYTNTPHEQAQQVWSELLISLGADAAFATGEGTLK